MNSGGTSAASSGTSFGQSFADQGPRYDSGKRPVFSRRAKVYRPDKRRKKVRYL